jgi:hypothetical protein
VCHKTFGESIFTESISRSFNVGSGGVFWGWDKS